jgi:hypothetical protein
MTSCALRPLQQRISACITPSSVLYASLPSFLQLSRFFGEVVLYWCFYIWLWLILAGLVADAGPAMQ